MTDGTNKTGSKQGWFPHERLDVFHAAMEFAAWVRSAERNVPRAKLRSQLGAACDSIVLNICEGAGSSGGTRRKHFQYAYASAAECHGAVCVCKMWGVPRTDEAIELLHRIRRMLAGLL